MNVRKPRLLGISDYSEAIGKAGDYGILSNSLPSSAKDKDYNKWKTIPAVITENYFYDNKDDVQVMINQPDLFAKVIVEGIISYVEAKGWVEGYNAL